MRSDHESAGKRLRLALPLAALATAALLGSAMAGWLNHGAEIFLSMASEAWAYCF